MGVEWIFAIIEGLGEVLFHFKSEDQQKYYVDRFFQMRIVPDKQGHYSVQTIPYLPLTLKINGLNILDGNIQIEKSKIAVIGNPGTEIINEAERIWDAVTKPREEKIVSDPAEIRETLEKVAKLHVVEKN